MQDLNAKVVRRFWEDVWTQGEVDVLPEIFAPGATENGEIVDLPQFGRAVESWRQKFPDFSATVQELLRLGEDRVASRVTYRGTHREQWAGLPATNRTFECIGIDLFRIHEGRIVELWHSADHLDMALQLGARLVPAES